MRDCVGRATSIGHLRLDRSYALRQKHEPERIAKHQSSRNAILSRGIVSKLAVALLVLTLISPIIAGVGTNEPVVRIAATAGPFGSPVTVNDNKANDQALPVIAAVPGRGLFVVWQDSRSGNWDIYTSVSLNGTSFAPNKRADDSIGTSAQKEPAVAVSLNGTIFLAWQDSRRSLYDNDIFFTKSYDGGATFTRNVKVDDSTSNITWQERPSIAVTDRGVIYIAWTDDRTGTSLRVRGAFSTDGGATFSPSAEIAPSGSVSGQTGVVVVSNGDRIFAAFTDNLSGAPHPYVCVSTNGGKSFGSLTRLDSTGSSGAQQSGVSIAPMPRGGIVAVWEDFRNGNGDIYACFVSANGAIQTPNFRVDDDSTGAYQEDACVASDQLGNIYVVWEDERNGLLAIRFAIVITGKTQPTASMEVATPRAVDEQMRASVIATEPGRVFVVWQDDRGGTYDVYSSTAYFAGLYDIPLVAGWNFVPVLIVGPGCRASTLGLMTGDTISGWNSSKAAFDQNYIVGVSPARNDFAISPSTGYWIYAGAAETLHLNGTLPTAKQHKPIAVPPGGGWAAIGFGSFNSTRHASDIPKMYSGGSIQTVATYDPITGKSTTYINGVSRTDFKLVVTQAVWCWCSANGTLTYDP